MPNDLLKGSSISLRTVQDWISKAEEGIDIRNIQPGRG